MKWDVEEALTLVYDVRMRNVLEQKVVGFVVVAYKCPNRKIGDCC